MQNHLFIKIKIKEPLGLRLLSLREFYKSAVCGVNVKGSYNKFQHFFLRLKIRGEMVTEGFLAGPSYVYPPYYSANLIPEPICQEAYLRVGRKEVRGVVGGLFVPGLLV